MTHEEREAYIKEAKRSFQNSQNGYYRPAIKQGENENVSFGFWKGRIVIAVIIFLFVFAIRNSSNDQVKMFHDKVAALIEKDISIDSVEAWFEQ